MNNNINKAISLLGSEFFSMITDFSNPQQPNNINVNTNTGVNASVDIIKVHKHIENDTILLCLEIPGTNKKDCKITLNGGYLHFEGKTNYQQLPSNKSHVDNDIGEFMFLKNITLRTKIDLSMHNINENNIKAVYINGLLKIKLKKKPKTNIDID